MITAAIHETGDTRPQNSLSMAAFEIIFGQPVARVRTDPCTFPFQA